jgi:hypothetical protein
LDFFEVCDNLVSRAILYFLENVQNTKKRFSVVIHEKMEIDYCITETGTLKAIAYKKHIFH